LGLYALVIKMGTALGTISNLVAPTTLALNQNLTI
jgi:hypothetical protein